MWVGWCFVGVLYTGLLSLASLHMQAVLCISCDVYKKSGQVTNSYVRV